MKNAAAGWYMTDEEIKVTYRQAKNQKDMIGILADLNVRSKAEMKEKLQELGVLLPLDLVEDPIAAFKASGKNGYTKKDAAAVRTLAVRGYSAREMSKLLHVGTKKLWQIMRENGISTQRKQGRKPWPKEREDRLRLLVAAGMTSKEIAAIMGVTYQTIWERRKRYGI